MYINERQVYKYCAEVYSIKDILAKSTYIGSNMQFWDSNKVYTYIYKKYIKDYGITLLRPFKMTFSMNAILNLLRSPSLCSDKHGVALLKKYKYEYILSFDLFLRFMYDLKEKTIREYTREYYRYKREGKHIKKLPRLYVDTYEAIFERGIDLDFEHKIQGTNNKFCYHLKFKGKHRNQLSKQVCIFWSKFFGVRFGSFIYLYKKTLDRRFKEQYRHCKNDKLIGFIKFDGSGLDYTPFYIFNLMLYLRLERGLKGGDLIKAMGYTIWRYGNKKLYDYRDHPVRNIKGGWNE